MSHVQVLPDVWKLLESVADPEIPVVNVVELGIVRGVSVSSDGHSVSVEITPTYSGCPAMRAIEDDIRSTLEQHFAEVDVRTVLSPAWTTEWLTASGRRKLAEFGIAPPHATAVAPEGRTLLPLSLVSQAGSPTGCPHCGSPHVERVSEFGSTACKALYRCVDCREPFDYFKAH